MPITRSPVLVGREAECSVLAALVDDPAGGGVVLVTGEAGIGKSRLLDEAARRAAAAGVTVLRGRAVQGGGTYRALAEAVHSRVRDDRLAGHEKLRPYRVALAGLIPGWARPGDTPQSTVDPTVVLGEGLLRLLRLVGGTGALLVLEDLHWADADTLALVDYLAGAGEGWPVRVVAAARTEDPDRPGALDRLARRPEVTHLPLDRLDPAQVEALAGHCAAGRTLSPAARRLLVERSEGLPYLVEELAAALLAGGRRDGGEPPVPPTLAGLVRERMSTLEEPYRRVVEVLAVLGGDPDPGAAAEVAGVAAELAARALDAAEAALLLEPGEAARWRHALTRDAVLAAVPAGRRRGLAARGAAVLERRDGPDDANRAADLWARAGEPARAADLLVRLARRDLAAGALRGAGELLDRAGATGAAVAAVAAERVHLYTLRGEPARALAAGAAVLDTASGAEHAELCLRLARAAVAASRWPLAEAYVRRAGRPDDPRGLLIAAGAAFGTGRLDDAVALAIRASRAGGGAAVRCEALTVLGRCALRRDPPAARAAFAEAAQVAAEHGLRPARVTALLGVGTVELYDALDSDALREARELARGAGLLADLHLLDMIDINRTFLVEGPVAAQVPAERAAARAARLGLHRARAMAELYVAAGRAAAGDLAGMRSTLDQALARPHASAEVLGVAPAVRGMYHLLRYDLPRASAGFDEGVAALGRDGAAAPVLTWGMWVLLRTVTGDPAAREVLRDAPAALPACNRGGLRYADAVVAGRDGQPRRAAGLFEAAGRDLAGQHWWGRLMRLVALDAAVTDGWGEPVAVLRADLDAFTRSGAPELARTCRDLLRRAGAPTRRGRGGAEVPAHLRRVAVTAREMDVLALLAEGMTNREIAARLYLSPRTVETHVASLLAKTGAGTRAGLRDLVPTPLTP